MCTHENQANLLCGICIITILLGLGVTLIVTGETLNIRDLTILGSIFLIFGVFVSTCIIAMIVRPLYTKHNNRKIGYSSSDLHDSSLLKQESHAYSQHGGSIIIRDAYAGRLDCQTVSSVMLEVRPFSNESTKSDIFLAKDGRGSSVASSSMCSFVTAPDHNRDSLILESETNISDDERTKSHSLESIVKLSDNEKTDNQLSQKEKTKQKVAFEQENSYVTKF